MVEAAKVPWLAISLGAVATVIGVVLGATNAASKHPSAVYLVMAGVLTTFGPVILSYAISKQLGRREAISEVRQQLDSISMNLGHAAADLDNGLRRNAAGVEENEVTLSIARSVTGALEVQIGQVQKLIGVPFSAQGLAANKEQLIEMGRIFSKAAEDNDPEALLIATRGIQKAVRPLVRQRAETGDEEVRCPSCGHQFLQRIGTLPGATSHAICQECQTPFNVHRDGGGQLFVRLASGAAPIGPEAPRPDEPRPRSTDASVTSDTVMFSEITCPTCGATVKYTGRRNPGRVVLCLECDTGITLDTAGRVGRSEQFERAAVSPKIATKRGLAVACPNCGDARWCSIRTTDGYFGFCVHDKLVLAVAAADAERFLEGLAG